MWCGVISVRSVNVSHFVIACHDACCVIKTFTYPIKINTFSGEKHVFDAYLGDDSWALPTIAQDMAAENRLYAVFVATPVASLITTPDADPRQRSESLVRVAGRFFRVALTKRHAVQLAVLGFSALGNCMTACPRLT